MANCRQCGEKLNVFEGLGAGLCATCIARNVASAKAMKGIGNEAEVDAAASRILLTTESAPNLPITERLDIITAEVVIGMHLFRDIASAFRDTFGGRSATMQQGLRDARKTALDELRREALALGADAVVAVDLDYSEISGGGKSMLFLVASGTAVKLTPTGGAEDRA